MYVKSPGVNGILPVGHRLPVCAADQEALESRAARVSATCHRLAVWRRGLAAAPACCAPGPGATRPGGAARCSLRSLLLLWAICWPARTPPWRGWAGSVPLNLHRIRCAASVDVGHHSRGADTISSSTSSSIQRFIHPGRGRICHHHLQRSSMAAPSLSTWTAVTAGVWMAIKIIHTETAFGKVETMDTANARTGVGCRQVFELEVRWADVRKLETYRFAQGDGVALTGRPGAGRRQHRQCAGAGATPIGSPTHRRRGQLQRGLGGWRCLGVAQLSSKTTALAFEVFATMTATVCGAPSPAAAARASLSRRQAD